MGLNINFNKTISLDGVENKTDLKVVEDNNGTFLEDEFGNTIMVKGDPIYGVTRYGSINNPIKILDELVKGFGVKFITDGEIDKYHYESEKYKDIDLYTITMVKAGYLLKFNGDIVIPERNKDKCKPYNEITDGDNGLPF